MLIQELLKTTQTFPTKPAANDPTRTLTYSQLITFSQVIRRIVLKETHCQRVGLMLPASVGGLGTIWGVLWAGRTVVPLNFLLQPNELAQIIADAQIDLIITTQHFESLLAGLPIRTLYLEQLNLKRRYVWEKLRRTPEPPDVEPDEVAVMLYTSGTTGQPKGVCLTHNNILSNCRSAIEYMQITPDERLLGMVPPFHVFGFTVLICLPVVLGTTTSYIPRFSPQAAYRAIRNENITILLAIPSMYNAIAHLKTLTPSDFQKITLAASGGEPLPRTVYDLFYERTGVRLVEGYGLTETSPIIAFDVPRDHHVGTVGRPIPGVETQIRDEIGNILPAGKEGELYVRGPLVMKGYYNRPQETTTVIDAEGWFRTSDIVRIDEGGYMSITGRAKDLIIVGGENVYPREIESVLEQHPAVTEAAVLGRADSKRGEAVVAFVALHENTDTTTDELRTYCRDHLAGFKVPREIILRPELPRGPTGKIVKRELNSFLEK